MKKMFLIGLIYFLMGQVHSQQLYQEYHIVKDSLRYGHGKNDLFPGGSKGFTLVLPEAKKEVKGTVLILDDDRVNLSDTSNIYQPANARGFAALYISTGIPVDLYFSERSLVYVDSLIKEVFSKYHLPNNYPDMSGFINEQVLAGNKNASLIVFSSSLTDPLKNDMRRHSSTWNLIDKNELMDWMVKMAGMEKGLN